MIAKLIIWSLPAWPRFMRLMFIEELAKRKWGEQWRAQLILRGYYD